MLIDLSLNHQSVEEPDFPDKVNGVTSVKGHFGKGGVASLENNHHDHHREMHI